MPRKPNKIMFPWSVEKPTEPPEREREIKENTRWGLYNFLTEGSLQCQESQIRCCFLGRRKSPQSPQREKEIKENTRWGLYNFLTEGSS